MTALLQLLGKPDCHLCELAQMELHALGVPCQVVDIETSLPLAVHYGLRIPVLRHGADGPELDWPFDARQVQAWLAGLAP